MPTHQLHNQCISWRVYTHCVSTYKIQRTHFCQLLSAIPDSLAELFELAASTPQVCVHLELLLKHNHTSACWWSLSFGSLCPLGPAD